MNLPNVTDFLESARNHKLTSGEMYLELVESGAVSPCPTTVTSSTVATIYHAGKGDTESANHCYKASIDHKSPYGDGEIRGQWLRSEVAELTGVELEAQASDRDVLIDLER